MIYIEAYRQTHVQYATGGISALNSHNIAVFLIDLKTKTKHLSRKVSFLILKFNKIPFYFFKNKKKIEILQMVPVKDMVDALRVTKDIPHLRTGSYVRLKRALYKDDLAQVSKLA